MSEEKFPNKTSVNNAEELTFVFCVYKAPKLSTVPLATPKHSSSACSHRSDVMYPASVEAAPLNFLVTAITHKQFHGILLTLTVLVMTIDALGHF